MTHHTADMAGSRARMWTEVSPHNQDAVLGAMTGFEHDEAGRNVRRSLDP